MGVSNRRWRGAAVTLAAGLGLSLGLAHSPTQAASYQVSAGGQLQFTDLSFAPVAGGVQMEGYFTGGLDLNFAGFDARLGTLTAVNTTYSVTYDLEFLAGNIAAPYPTLRGLYFLSAQFTGPGLRASVPRTEGPVTGSPVLIAVRYRGSSPSFPDTLAAPASALPSLNQAYALHLDILRPQNTPVAVDAYPNAWPGLETIPRSASVTARLAATVEYIYTPAIPEPAPQALMLAGLPALLLARRLRRTAAPGAGAPVQTRM